MRLNREQTLEFSASAEILDMSNCAQICQGRRSQYELKHLPKQKERKKKRGRERKEIAKL